MIENFGGIIKLNRQQEGLTLKYIKHETGISQGHLSRIENNKEKISYKNAKLIFDVMGIPITEEDLNEQFEKDFMSFYLDVIYLRDYSVSFKKIKSYHQYIRSSFSYIKYILAHMIYDTLIGEKNISKKYVFIKEYFDYLEALNNYKIALKYGGNLYSESMLYFHIGATQIYEGANFDALKYTEKARTLFAQTVNLKRIVSANFNIARILYRNGDFKEFERISINCIQAYKELNMKMNIVYTYNNLIWGYVRSEKYEKVFEYCDEALELELNKHCIYFYMSVAAYKLNQIDKAREYIKLARETMDEPTKYMETMIKAYQILMMKEKKNIY